MIIEVLLFAAARELVGRDIVKVELASPIQHHGASADANSIDDESASSVTVDCVVQALGQQCPELQPLLPSCRIAVDCEYVGPEASVSPKAEFALIPPVSGG